MGKVIPRIRLKGKYLYKPGHRLYYIADPLPYGNPYINVAGTTVTPKKLEVMWDCIGYEDCDFNPCWHEKALKSADYPRTQEPRMADAVGPPLMYIYTGCGHYVDQLTAGRNIPLDLGQWLDDFAANANYHYTTAVEPVGSLLNFIIEAIELCELNLKVLDNIWKAISKAIKTFRDMIAKGAGYWLAWNFAIKPTIRDVKNMIDTLKIAQKRLKWLRERNHKNTKVKYREGPRFFEGTATVPHSTPVIGERTNPPADAERIGREADLEPTIELDVAYTAKVSLTSWAWVRFDIDDAYLDEFYGLGTVMMALQGLYNPMAVIWEAIPFSWLIDYFRTQKNKLEQLAATDLSPLANGRILSVGWAIKVQMRGDCEWVINRNNPAESKAECGTIMYSLYSRQPGLPTSESSPFVIPKNWYHWSIILALIASFRRRG